MKYPIGIQSFEQIIEDDYVYLDKTTRRIKPVHHLIDVLIKMRQQANKTGWRTGAEPIIRQE